MALTMTRTRTQTTLTKLAEMVANVHGELAFVNGLLLAGTYDGPRGKTVTLTEAQQAGLEARRVALLGQREALYATVRQFDPGLNPADIGALNEWSKRYSIRAGYKTIIMKYLSQLAADT